MKEKREALNVAFVVLALALVVVDRYYRLPVWVGIPL